MKPFIRLFLALGFFLLNGFGNLHADTCVDSCVQAGTSFRAAPYYSPDFLTPLNEVFKTAPSDAGTRIDEVDITNSENEDEDNELPELKKPVRQDNYFTSLFYSRPAGHPFTDIHKRYSFRKHFAYTSHQKYITLRVMRI